MTTLNKNYSIKFYLFLFTLIFILITSCGDENPAEPSEQVKFESDNVVVENMVEELVEEISASGGIIKINDESSLLNGFSLEVPEKGYNESRTFKISSAKIIDHKLGEYFNPVSPLINISNGGGYSEYPMKVEIPTQLGNDEVAVCFFYDEISGDIEVVPTVAQNGTTIIVETRHFALSDINSGGTLSKINRNGVIANLIVSSVKESLLSGQTVISSGFTPGIDDWEFINYGSYIADGGHCAGQSMTAMWYFYEKRLKGEPPLFGRYDTFNDPANPAKLWEDNPLGYRFASTIQEDFDWGNWIKLVNLESRHPKLTYYTFIAAMLLTGEPQFVIIKNSATNAGHAMILYKIDLTEGKMYIADPNYPNNRGTDGSSTIRTISYSNEKFLPYDSFQKAGDPGTTYDQIAIFGKTANIDWKQIARRFEELEEGTIGNDRFTDYDLIVQTPQGPVHLFEGMQINSDTLKFICKNENIPSSLPGTNNLQKVYVFNEDGNYLGQADGNGLTQMRLSPGENKFGIYICGYKNGKAYNYFDFKWITVNHPAPDELPYTTCWMKMGLSNLVWEHKDVTTGNVYNAYSGGTFGGLTFEGSFSNNKFKGTIDRTREFSTGNDTTKGSISVQLNSTRDMIISLEYSIEHWSYSKTLNRNSYLQSDLTLQNVPIHPGRENSFLVEGTSVCDNIIDIESFKRNVIPNSDTNYEETLVDFSCISGSEELSVYFSN